MNSDGLFSLINQPCQNDFSHECIDEGECGIPLHDGLSAEVAALTGVKANEHGDITVSNMDIEGCIKLWSQLDEDDIIQLKVLQTQEVGDIYEAGIAVGAGLSLLGLVVLVYKCCHRSSNGYESIQGD